MKQKLEALLKKYKIKCSYIQVGETTVILGLRETRSTAREFYNKLKSIGLTPKTVSYGRWECRVSHMEDSGFIQEDQEVTT